MPTQSMIELLKRVSIRGRMALAAACFERTWKAMGLQGVEIEEVTRYFWDFVSSSDGLDVWENSAPNTVEVTLDVVGGEFFGGGWKLDELNSVCLQWPLAIIVMIDLLYHLGRANLYGGITGWSELTLTPTVAVLDLVEKLGLPLPELKPFLRSPFGSYKELEAAPSTAWMKKGSVGWGDPRPRSFFAEAAELPGDSEL